MTKQIETISLIVVPILLIILVSTFAIKLNEIVATDNADKNQEKVASLIEKIQSRNITINQEQVVSFLKTYRDLEESQSRHSHSLAATIRGFVELLLMLALLQLSIVSVYLWKKYRSNTI